MLFTASLKDIGQFGDYLVVVGDGSNGGLTQRHISIFLTRRLVRSTPRLVSFGLSVVHEKLSNECILPETHRICLAFHLRYHFARFLPTMQHKMEPQQQCLHWNCGKMFIVVWLMIEISVRLFEYPYLLSIKCWPNFFKVVLCETSLKIIERIPV